MDLGLEGRKAFVGGSSAGLGRAVAEALLEEGAEVHLCARDAGRLERTRSELGALHGDRVVARAADLSRPAEAYAAVAAAAADLGGLDVLVTNSGGPKPGRFDEHDLTEWRDAVDLLLLSTVEMIRAALPHLRASDQPRIIAVASTSVKQPIDGLLLSNAVRAGVAGLMKTLSQELGREGITVNVVCPGLMATGRIDALFTDQARRQGTTREAIAAARTAAIPLGRVGRPEELGALVAFLASARAGYLTGAVLPVDGGALRGW
jgi:3-oxoacyl-[acyl-carrier protein] reductase